LAATGEQLLRWLAPEGVYEINFALQGVSEPLILLAGIAGAVLALSRRHGMGLLWLFWAVAGIAGAGLAPALGLAPAPSGQPQGLPLHAPFSPVLWLLPLAGLGGLAVEALARALLKSARGASGWVYGALSLALWTHSGLVLARYSRYGQPADLLLAGIGLALLVVLGRFSGVALSVPEGDETPEEATRRALLFVLYRAALVGSIVLLAATFAAGWRVAQVCPGEPTCAPGAVSDPVAPDLHRLAAETERVLTQTPARAETECRLRLTHPDPAVAWALRDFGTRDHPQDKSCATADVMIAPAGASVPEGYYGTAFTLRRAWNPPRTLHEWVRWGLYRAPLSPLPPADSVILWVREDVRGQ
ncbi:MAG: hypothetical protein ACK4WK_00165, partial [Anaerolineae bacterium]